MHEIAETLPTLDEMLHAFTQSGDKATVLPMRRKKKSAIGSNSESEKSTKRSFKQLAKTVIKMNAINKNAKMNVAPAKPIPPSPEQAESSKHGLRNLAKSVLKITSLKKVSSKVHDELSISGELPEEDKAAIEAHNAEVMAAEEEANHRKENEELMAFIRQHQFHSNHDQIMQQYQDKPTIGKSMRRAFSAESIIQRKRAQTESELDPSQHQSDDKEHERESDVTPQRFVVNAEPTYTLLNNDDNNEVPDSINRVYSFQGGADDEEDSDERLSMKISNNSSKLKGNSRKKVDHSLTLENVEDLNDQKEEEKDEDAGFVDRHPLPSSATTTLLPFSTSASPINTARENDDVLTSLSVVKPKKKQRSQITSQSNMISRLTGQSSPNAVVPTGPTDRRHSSYVSGRDPAFFDFPMNSLEVMEILGQSFETSHHVKHRFNYLPHRSEKNKSNSNKSKKLTTLSLNDDDKINSKKKKKNNNPSSENEVQQFNTNNEENNEEEEEEDEEPEEVEGNDVKEQLNSDYLQQRRITLPEHILFSNNEKMNKMKEKLSQQIEINKK